jgi:hypothetical protein
MSITEDYLKRAEECERLAAECQSDSNREIFLDIAAKWKSMAADAAAGAVPAAPAKMQDRLQDAATAQGKRGVTTSE